MKLEKTIDKLYAENEALTKTGNVTIWTTIIGTLLLGAVSDKKHNNLIEIMSLDKDG